MQAVDSSKSLNSISIILDADGVSAAIFAWRLIGTDVERCTDAESVDAQSPSVIVKEPA
jgi:hypothetical protein